MLVRVQLENARKTSDLRQVPREFWFWRTQEGIEVFLGRAPWCRDARLCLRRSARVQHTEARVVEVLVRRARLRKWKRTPRTWLRERKRVDDWSPCCVTICMWFHLDIGASCRDFSSSLFRSSPQSAAVS